jgi:hypothetical protein
MLRVGLTEPNAAIGNTDDNVIRMVQLANEEGEELSSRHDWQALIREETHTTTAAESQGLMTAIAGSDFLRIRNDTFWNRSLNRPWYPVDDVQWQQMKASSITGPNNYFRIRGNYLIVTPVPSAGDTLAFEWITKNWCESAGGTGQDAWAADTDVARLSESIMLQGLVWRWKKANGLEYAEDFRQYEERITNAMMRDGAPRRIHMGGGMPQGRNIPDGSWSL